MERHSQCTCHPLYQLTGIIVGVLSVSKEPKFQDASLVVYLWIIAFQHFKDKHPPVGKCH